MSPSCGVARPIIRHLRLDHSLRSCRPRGRHEAIFQEAVPGQPPDQAIDLLVDGPAGGGESARAANPLQFPRALAAAALNSRADRIASKQRRSFRWAFERCRQPRSASIVTGC